MADGRVGAVVVVAVDGRTDARRRPVAVAETTTIA
jgi:hypothetical protein